MTSRWLVCVLSSCLMMGAAARATEAEDALRAQLAAGLARGMPLVACVIEQLIDEGRLSLDATGADLLGRELVAGIPNAERATARQLLDHTSGVPSWEFDPEWIPHGRGSAMDVSHTWGKTEALDYLRSGRDSATNEPGLGYGYSNSNYTLLGLIIEKVTMPGTPRTIRKSCPNSRA